MRINNCLLCDGMLPPIFELTDIFSFKKITNKFVCPTCWRQFTYLSNQPTCNYCGRLMATRTVCTDCQKWIIRQDNFINTAIFAYDNSMQLFMKQYKFNGDYRLRLIFSAFMQAFINQRYKVENLVIVPVPVTETTLLQRGFNQVCGLLSEVKYMDCLTMKAISKVPQSMKTRQDRLLTPQPFELRPNLYKNLTGKNILIVDDIYTTGVTIRHAAKALSIVQPSKIMGLTLAR